MIPVEYYNAMSEESKKHYDEIVAKYGDEVFDDRKWYFNDDKHNLSIRVSLHDYAGNPDLEHAFIDGAVNIGDSVITGELIESFTRFTPEPLYEVAGCEDEEQAYNVTIATYGFVQVNAKSESEAMEKANKLSRSEINWSDNWEASDATLAE